ncbi:aminodeoxychorismate synthase, component I, partial [bacterium]|nr:aminodeoxychorismate synthase, component I [bacterium]
QIPHVFRRQALQVGDIDVAIAITLDHDHPEARHHSRCRVRSVRRLRDEAGDEILARSEKDRAELTMIVDLLRNDLSQLCLPASVHVPDPFSVESFTHVHHLVSTVEGRLKNPRRIGRCLETLFPGGSITGAPKYSAMSLIEALEPVSRGPYTGAIGYAGFNGKADFSITIRTAYAVDGWLHYHTGCGIVADSDPDAEWDETNAKAQGFLNLASSALS